ncbi:MAG: DinB family protein [Planctomycetota bacterium]
MSNSTTDASPILTTGLQSMEFARGITDMLLSTLEPDHWFKPPCPNANHAGWIVGHLALTDQAFFSALGGGQPLVPEAWDGLFGGKSVAHPDASKFPPIEELKAALAATRERTVEWLRSLSEAELLEPIEGDLAQFAKTRAHLMGTLAFHEGMHVGQLSVARRAMGMPPVF